MAMSMAELALLLAVLVGVPVLSIRIVRSGLTDDLARPLKFLHGGLWGAILSFALAMGAGYLLTVPSGVVYNFLLAAFYVCACLYWTAVGVLAHRLQRSWILWVVVGLATLAIGFFATYILLAVRVRKELAPTEKKLASL
ncbi:MAG TPA: hypothetical protein VLI71_09235 [Gammaproteobacteria bacterium]|nr:hypothetical protein [Gammaproteobacteria bacterium]